MTYEPLPGTIGLTQIRGQVGLLIRIGQWLVAKLSTRKAAKVLRASGLLRTLPDKTWNDVDWADYQHAFIYLGNGKVIEAEPGGARIADVTEYADIYWCEAIAGQYTTAELAEIAAYAATLKGTPYSFLDYFVIAGHALHLPNSLLKLYVTRTHHLICSVLDVVAYDHLGWPLFKDGRWAGYVDPLDLYLLDKGLASQNI